MRYLMLAFSVFAVFSISEAYGNGEKKKLGAFNAKHLPAVSKVDTATRDTATSVAKAFKGQYSVHDSLRDALYPRPSDLSLFPAVSLQQYVKGSYGGVYVQESSGEPGTNQHMFIRGSAFPLLSAKELYQSQPLVILDGVPMIAEHPFAYDIQQYDFNRLGPATNILSNIDIDNLESVEVLKDVNAIAAYGPRAVNGVIILKSKAAKTVRKVSFNSYMGLAQRPGVATINGSFENAFRQQFYDLYTANGRYSNDESYPTYLSDSLNAGYYGPSNWTDLYYRNGMVYSINASITGGTERANFRFSLGNMKNEGVADNTGVDRYSAMFNINMRPVNWLLFSAMVNANRVERDRNRSLRDRFVQMNYFPDLSAPLSPNKQSYGAYLSNFDNGFDENKSNIIEGYANVGVDLGKVKLNSRFAVDYNEGYRDLFYPRPLMQNTSYASNYYGFNQRLIFDNTISYRHNNSLHNLHLEAGQSIQWDTYKYNNAYAYKGVNDFIKINLLESDPNNGNYLNPLAFPKELVFRFLDRTRDNLVSFYTKGDYTFNEKYSLSTVLRADGSSNAQPTSQWFFSPSASFTWNLKNELLKENQNISALNIEVGAGRIGRLHTYDNYSQGPQYMSNVGYTGNLTVPGYNAFSVLTRPYSFGWVGYGIPWSYSDQINAGMSAVMLKDRLRLSVDWYSKTEKGLLLGIPEGAEYGYKQSIESGMSVNNSGVDIALSGDILKKKTGTSWTGTLAFNFNKNELKALPGGLSEIIVDNRKLKVGESIDRYWLLKNDGIYKSNSEVPVINGERLKFNGTALKAGDPRWMDTNGDNIISDADKVLTGHSLPVLTGSFNNALTFGKWNVDLNFYYSVGRDIINQNMANRFDFINREGQSNINSVKEITFWEKTGDYDLYPLYNPWSTVIPYRTDQDLFLEDGSFLKLRTLSLGYDLTSVAGKKINFSRLYVYGTVNNVFTLTKYSGRDPELVSYTGYDTGYGLPIPRTFTVGVKMEL